MMVPVDDTNVSAAAEIHAAAWRQSHKDFCSETFVEQHTAQRQKAYLIKEMELGKQLYMLVKEIPVGIVSVIDSLIENLYVLPSEQGKGYGTELLNFAVGQCQGTPHLWVLNRNQNAMNFCRNRGFFETGSIHPLAENLFECEMAYKAAEPIVPKSMRTSEQRKG